MAEGWARTLASTLPEPISIEANSAGLEAHGLNPNAVVTMAKLGVDISNQQSKLLSPELLDNADILISVCSHADEHCPALPVGTEKCHLPFDDPARAMGTDAEILADFERVCLEIKRAIADLLQALLSKELNDLRGDIFNKEDVEVISRTRSHDGFVPIEVLQLKHRLFSGGWSTEIRRELAVRDTAVGVLLFDPKRDAVVLVRQFRTGILTHEQSPWILEIVAGMAGSGEATADVVKREAKEEANCDVTELIPICEYFNSPGWSDEKISLYCGLVDASSCGGIYGLDEENEDILVVTMRFDEAVIAVEKGSINNAMAVIAIQWLQLNKKTVIDKWNRI
jgi:ADP-ribose pyrophosphatase